MAQSVFQMHDKNTHFMISSMPQDLLVFRVFMAFRISACEIGSSNSEKVGSVSVLSKFCMCSFTSSGTFSPISDDRCLKYSLKSFSDKLVWLLFLFRLNNF